MNELSGHNWTLHVGDVRETLPQIPAGSVQLSMCSPPYWNLRDYGTGTWEGGDAECDHKRPPSGGTRKGEQLDGSGNREGYSSDGQYPKTCPKCGAVRVDQQLGSEPTIDEYVETLVGVFDGVKRVLRDDGVCVVNLGDSYSSGGRNSFGPQNGKQQSNAGSLGIPRVDAGLPAGNQCLVPHKFAIAMQAAGWILRETVVWAKAFSGQFTRGSCMPESLNGTRWERCRVKVGNLDPTARDARLGGVAHEARSEFTNRNDTGNPHREAVWQPCPGCERCEPNDGYVLRRGSWRHTSAHEYVFVFVKSMGYFSDQMAVKEKSQFPGDNRKARSDSNVSRMNNGDGGNPVSETRNPRNVLHYEPDLFAEFLNWRMQRDGTPANVLAIGTQSFPGSHFATFPEALVAHFIKAFTPDKGVCPQCLAPWARVVEATGESTYSQVKQESWREMSEQARKRGICPSRPASGQTRNPNGTQPHLDATKTLGWRPTCECEKNRAALNEPIYDSEQTIPATVLDPFAGSGTTLLVAKQLGRRSIGIELSAEYAEMAKRRIEQREGAKQPEPLVGQMSLFGNE